MRRLLVFTLICAVSQAPIVAASAMAPPEHGAEAHGASATDIKPRVELMGVGAAVELTLVSGGKVRGTIGTIDVDTFDVRSIREGAPARPVAYEEVAELKLTKTTYRSGNSPDPQQLRRVVAGLNVGRHVAVTIGSGQTFRGDLAALASDHFVLQLDGDARLLPVAYNDVKQLGPNLSNAAKFSMVGAAAAASVALLVKLARGDAYRTGRGADR